MSTILVVDDDNQLSKFIQKVLVQEGYDVLGTTDGKACLELYETAHPEIVLIDIIMPEKDGLTTIQEIRKFEAQPKIIAMSGGLVLTPENYLEEAKRVGADYAISKPIDRTQLIDAINQVLDQ